MDALISYLKNKKWEFPWLGLITGLIIAVLLGPGNILFAIAVPAAAIILREVIKFKNRNIFNPAALGL
ncbi:MAG: hypothetical protein QMD85_03935, partial [Candidatus Aenigmarchaeota archaeon]|nr:hypothetical protein [Candidatus Aenigmarchaeota archaeon]MDI6722707.1 hypothetical protein [Candidatus Aenigmarchaeota archaeon]